MSASFQMADAICIDKTGYPLVDYVADLRDQGDSWEDITSKLRQATDGIIDVSWMTVRRWSAA